MNFWQWLVTDWHWFWVCAAIALVWSLFFGDFFSDFFKSILNHRKEMKELELRIAQTNLKAEQERRKPLPPMK